MLTRGIDLTDFPSLGPTSVHHLSSDLFDEPRRATPPVPPGLEGLGQSLPLDLDDDDEDMPRRSTPTIPPGFSAPVTAAIKDEHSNSRPPSRSSSRASLRRGKSQILPAIPVLPGTPVRAPTPLRHETKAKAAVAEEVATPTKRGRSEFHLAKVESVDTKDAALGSEIESNVKLDPKPSEVKKSKRKEKAEKAAALAAEAAAASLPLKSFQASGASKEEPKKVVTKTIDLVQDPKPGEITAPAKNPETPVKKNHPGKLDLAAAVTKAMEPPASATSTPSKVEAPGLLSRPSFNQIVSSRPQSPSVASDIASKKAPRTLRVIPTPKTDVPPPPPAPIVAPALPPIMSTRPSRQPSFASIYPPGTPSSEQISDNVSITSTSLSRAGSPLPTSNRVGSAPVRAKTKNQQKKDRQERAKQIEEEQIQAAQVQSPKSGAVQEAITSRKKKSKKSSTTPLASSTPVASRPASPKPKPKVVEEPVKPVIKEEEEKEEVKPVKPVTPVKKESPPPPPPVAPLSPPALTPASLISEIRSEHGLLSGSLDAFFRPIAQVMAHYKPSQSITYQDLNTTQNPIRTPELKREDLDSLLKGNPFHSVAESDRIWDRVTVTPGGSLLRHLEPALEDRFLAVEEAHRSLPSHLQYHSQLPAALNDTDMLPSMDLHALRRELDGLPGRGMRSANAMEKAVEEGSKKGSFLVDTAGKYVNEFIMPPVPLSPSPKKEVKEEVKWSVQELERKLTEARRATEEKEALLRKAVKKSRKVVGMTH